jgi:hypothetical protein
MTKRLMFLSMIWAGVALVPAISFARLGETEDELIERFGQPVSEITDKDELGIADKELVFKKDDTIIHATIYKGRCASEGYRFMDRNGKDVSLRGLAVEKANAALGANAAGFRWVKAPDPTAINPDMLHAWNRSDGKVAAVVWENNPAMLEIQDMNYVRADNQAKQAKAAGDSGF